MKNRLNKIAFSTLSICMLLFLAYSCNNDDGPEGGNFNITTLEAALDDARNLLTSTEEGTMAGDQQPGSKATLESVIAWIEKRITNSKSQADIDDAGVKLQAAVQTYMASVVSTAFPYIKQGGQSAINISESIKSTLGGPFTIQGQFYIVDLNERVFSSNLFACNEDPGGAPNGFTVRYFSNGTVNLLTGNGSWTEVNTPEGVFSAGEWFDVAYTNTGDKQTLFVNGQEIISLDKQHVVAPSVSLAIGDSPFFRGRSANLLARKFTVWSTVLDQATIQANATAEIEGTEANLEAFFPFGSDLGTSFDDVTGNHTATLEGDVEWVAAPPVIVLDYTAIDGATSALTALKATVVEGDQDGDYPLGTIAFIDELLENAVTVRDNETRQTALDNQAASLTTQIERINTFLVGDTNGITVDEDDSSHVGMRITPNYTPQGDFTYECDINLADLLVTSNGGGEIDLFGSNVFGFRVQGYTELTEENVLNSGGGWNFTFDGSGFGGPFYDSGSVRSGVWQHVAVVHDETAKTTKIYVDGKEVTTPAFDADGNPVPRGVANLAAAAAEMWLGRVYTISDGSFKDFRIWNSVRTPEQLNMEIDGTESGLQVYFPLNRVKGLKFKDVTGNYNAEMLGVIWNN